MKNGGFCVEPSIFYEKRYMKDVNPTLILQFVTALGRRSRSPMGALTVLILGVAAVNVLLGSFDGEASQVLIGLGVVAAGLLGRSKFLIKRQSKRYENDPHLGKNET